MINKLIKQFIPACCLLFGVFASCASEDEPGKASQSIGISLELTTAGQTRSSVDPGTEAERKINSISVWFFNDGASDTEKAMFYTNIASSSSTGNITLNFTDEELRLHSMTSEGSYEVFVVANPPADATINGETTLADLKGYSYTAATRPGSPFCMTGSSAGGHNFGINSLISIPLLRVASRLDIAVKNATGKSWSIDKISIAGDQKSVLLFAPASGTTTLASDAFGTEQTVLSTPTTNEEVACSGYIYENRSADAVKVVIEGSVDGTAKTWTAELTPNGAATLPRNTICGVTLNLKESTPILPTDVGSTIKDWDTTNVDGSIHGSYLYVDHKTVHVIYAIGGIVEVTTNASQIHVDWKNAPGFYLSGYQDDTEATLPLTDLSASLEFFLSGGTSDVVPNGEVILTAGNISQKIILMKDNTNLLFDLQSIKVDGIAVKDGGSTIFPAWSGKVNSHINITMNVNVTWAYKMSIYDSEGYLAAAVQKSIIYYSGTPGETSSGQLEIKYDDDIYNNYMPLKVVIELFVINYSELGAKIQTFEFSVVKP